MHAQLGGFLDDEIHRFPLRHRLQQRDAIRQRFDAVLLLDRQPRGPLVHRGRRAHKLISRSIEHGHPLAFAYAQHDSGMMAFAFIERQLAFGHAFGRKIETVHQLKRFRALSRNPLLCGFTSSPQRSANSCNLAFCSLLRRAGTSTLTRTLRSPVP